MSAKYLYLLGFVFLFINCNDDDPDPGPDTQTIDLKADFSSDRNKILEGEQIKFTNSSEGTSTSIEWTFEGGDPATSTDANPTVTYFTFGTYNATLKVTNTATSEENSKNVVIEVCQALDAGFNLSNDKINEGQEVAFLNTSIGVVETFEWTFEGGEPATSSDENPTVIYPVYGDYTATLKITNSATSDESVITKEVSVCPSNGMLAWYPLDGNVDDLSGNNFNGNILGASEYQDMSDESRVGYSFDGVDDYVSTSTMIDDDLSEGASFVAWINLSELGTAGRFISNYNGVSQGGDCLGRVGFVFSSTNENRLRLTYSTDGNDYVGRMSAENDLKLDTWHHVVGTWNGELESSSFKLYVDGVQTDDIDFEDGFPAPCGYIESENPFEFGRGLCAAGPCAFLNGKIDEVRIYNRPLSREEIEFLANQ